MDKLRIIIYSLLALLPVNSVRAQTETVFAYPDPDKTVRIEASCADGNGNTYILSTLYRIDYGHLVYGSVISKLNRNGEQLWSRLYPIANIPTAQDQSGFDRIPAKQILLINSQLFVPYNTYFSYLPCDSATSHSLSTSTRNGGLMLDRADGSVLMQQLFIQDSLCSYLTLFKTFPLSANHFSYQYYQGKRHNRYFEEIRDSLFQLISRHTILDTPASLTDYNVAYDTAANQFIYGDRQGLHWYDTGWISKGSIMLPHLERFHFYMTYLMAFSHDYLAVYYGGLADAGDTSVYYLTVLDRNRNIRRTISVDQVKDIAWHDKALFLLGGVPYIGLSDSLKHPAEITRLNSDLTLRSRASFGHSFLEPRSMAFDGDSVLMISGTIYGKHPFRNTGNRNLPDSVYWYRLNLSDPLQQAYNCNSIRLSPNPAGDMATLALQPLSQWQGAALRLSSVFGQRLYQATINNDNDVTIPLNQVPAGIYFLQVKQAERQCNLKFEHR